MIARQSLSTSYVTSGARASGRAAVMLIATIFRTAYVDVEHVVEVRSGSQAPASSAGRFSSISAAPRHRSGKLQPRSVEQQPRGRPQADWRAS